VIAKSEISIERHRPRPSIERHIPRPSIERHRPRPSIERHIPRPIIERTIDNQTEQTKQIQTLSKSGDPEGYAVPTTHVTPVVLFGLVVKVAKIS
jgi:hypothetical protein